MNEKGYDKGQWNAICDVCGFQFKSKELKKRWDGLMVCAEDFETRHPLDFVRGRKEDTSVPWTRKDSDTSTANDQITTADSPYTMTSSYYVIEVDASGGNVTITLPLCSDYTVPYGNVITIQRTDTGSNTVTIQRQGADTINGATSETLSGVNSKRYHNDAVSTWSRA